MKTKYLAISLGLVIAAGAATAALAHPHRGGSSMFGHHLGFIARRLDLSGAQKTQIESMIQAERPNFQPVVKQLATQQQLMLAATRGGSLMRRR